MATKETNEPSQEVKPAAKAARKKAVAKTVKPEKAANRYFYAVGRRKTAVAQVRLHPGEKSRDITVNEKAILEYFGTPALVAQALQPLKTVGLEEAFMVTVVTRGGGLHGQAGAVSLGVARALLKHDALLRPTLKAQGLLTRDARAVERKKAGLKKARRAPQWSKR